MKHTLPILFTMLLCGTSAFPQEGCYSRLQNDTLTIGNSRIERRFVWNGGNLMTQSLTEAPADAARRNGSPKPTSIRRGWKSPWNFRWERSTYGGFTASAPTLRRSPATPTSKAAPHSFPRAGRSTPPPARTSNRPPTCSRSRSPRPSTGSTPAGSTGTRGSWSSRTSRTGTTTWSSKPTSFPTGKTATGATCSSPATPRTAADSSS